MNKSKHSTFEIWNTRLTVIIPTITGLTFLIGAFWADLYFKQFHISFFKVSGFSGAFHFLFSNIKIVAMSVIIATAFYLAFGIALYVVVKLIEKLIYYFFSDSINGEDEKLTPPQKLFISLAFAGVALFGISTFIIDITESVAGKTRFNVHSKNYEAVTIYYANPMPAELKCVYSLGSIGNYNAYLSRQDESEFLETYLIKESAITSIKYPLSYLQTTSNKTRKQAIEDNWNKLCD